MTLQNKLIAGVAAAAFAIALSAATLHVQAAEAEHDHGDAVAEATADDHGAMGHGMMGHGMMGQGMMGQGMMGQGMMGMGMMGGDASPAELGTIHQLVVNHDRITRTVTKLADGIRTVTESDDPQIAQLIKDHVAQMIPRVEARRDLNLPIETDALRAIMRDGDKVKTTVETTDKGSIVTQTSGDPAVVAALQEHAGDVSKIVARGMEAIHTAMMSNHGAMGQGMMGQGMGQRTGEGMSGHGMMGRGMMNMPMMQQHRRP